MIFYTNECVSCGKLPCLGEQCPNRNVPHYICDKCGEEFDPDELYDTSGEWLCEDCLKKQFPKVSE